MSPFYLPNIGAGFFPDNTGGYDGRVAGIRSPDTGFVYNSLPAYYSHEGYPDSGYGSFGSNRRYGDAVPQSVIGGMERLTDSLTNTEAQMDVLRGIGGRASDALLSLDPLGDFQAVAGRSMADAQAQLGEARGRLDDAQAEGRERTDRFLGKAEGEGAEHIGAVEGRVDAALDRMERAINDAADNTAGTVAALGDGMMRDANAAANNLEQDLIRQGVPVAQAKAQAQELRSSAGRDLSKQAANVYNQRDQMLASMGTRAADLAMQGAGMIAGVRTNVMGNLTSLRQAAIQQDTTFAGQVASLESSALQSMNSLRQAEMYGTNQANQIKANLTKYAFDFQMQAEMAALNHQLKANSLAMQGFQNTANLHMTNYYA